MLSIIIPTLNEAAIIGKTISRIASESGPEPYEIIVADGGSEDETIAIAQNFPVRILHCPEKGRAAQMNFGAKAAIYEVLYFLHADTNPPEEFMSHIKNAVRNGYTGGCFRLAFDHSNWFLKTQCWFTQFNVNAVRFGDQSLFVLKEVFEKCGGYREDHLIMEDQEIIHRIRIYGKFKVLDQCVTTSARKYRQNGILRMQGIFYRLWFMYYLGFSQQQLMGCYQKWIQGHSKRYETGRR